MKDLPVGSLALLTGSLAFAVVAYLRLKKSYWYFNSLGS